MAVGFPLKTTYANGDVYSAGDVNDTNGTINLLTSSTLSSSAGKNPIINGGMDIWQRGTSAIGTNYNYAADRWLIFRGSFAAGMTASRQTSVPEGLRYALRLARDSGNTGTQNLEFRYALETADSIRFQNKTVTWSFWARAGANWSAATANFGLYTGTGTDQATTNVVGLWTGSANPITQNVALTTSWVRYSYTATISATATQIGLSGSYTPTGTAGANDWIEFTGMQLELGSTATTFSRAGGTIQGELAACRYYYKRVTGSANGVGSFTNFGTASSTTQITTTYNDNTPMRIVPSSVDFASVAVSDINNARINASSVAIDTTFSTPTTFVLNLAVSGATQYRPYTTLSQSGAIGYIGLSAEL
jgi:hypothetical protein